ncbi:MAG: capsule assembly Wzi family protein [Pseudomonadota bacterium]
MRSYLTYLLIFIFCMVMPVSSHAWTRSTSNVPCDNSLYRDLDKLVAFGLVEPPIVGQRPYPRSEFARMTAEAIRNFEKNEADAARAESLDEFIKRSKRSRETKIVLERLEDEFQEELIDMGAAPGERMRYRLHPFEKINFYATYLNSPPTTIPVNNGRGSINAVINPLKDYDLGRHPIDGFLNAEELVGRFQAGRFISGYARSRFEVDMYRTDDMTGHAYLQNGYATFKAGNFSMEVGRDSMLWGFGERGSLLYSTNARPLDGFWLTNPTPARLPWVFKYLGRWRYTLYAANFGPGYSRKWAWLAGYKLSLAPAKYVELGFGHVVQIGGEGMPTPSAIDVIGEFFGFRPAGTDPSSPNLSNHSFEIDYMVRIPQLRGVMLYGNIAIEDKWKSIKKTLKQGCSYLWGIYLPAINPSGSADLRIEYVKTSPLQYRHGLYSDGWTLNRRIIGSDAGPDADAVHALFRKTISPKIWYGVTFGWDYRRSDTYTELVNPNGTAGDVVKIASGPTEQRLRGLFDIDWQMKKHLGLHLTLGYERVGNLNFQQGVDRNNYLGGLEIKLDLDRYFAFARN